jgi:hypothetical protein
VGDGEPDDLLWPAPGGGRLDLVDPPLLELMERDGVAAVQRALAAQGPPLALVQAVKQVPPSKLTGLAVAYDGRLLPGKLLVGWMS